MKQLHINKSIALAVLLFAIVFSLCACGGNGGASSSMGGDTSSASSGAASDSSAAGGDTSSDTSGSVSASDASGNGSAGTTDNQTSGASSNGSNAGASSSGGDGGAASQAGGSTSANTSGAGTGGTADGSKAPSSISPAAASAVSAIKSVLQGQTKFLDTGSNNYLNISQLGQVINPDITVTVSSFAVAYIGNGNTPAAILPLAVNGDSYGSEVFSYQDGVVYGYTFSIRQFGDLRTDGSFTASSSAFATGICAITFDKNTYSIDQFTYCEPNTDAQGNQSESYFVNHQSAAKGDFDAAYSRWQQIPLVTYYDFTSANIDAQLS